MCDPETNRVAREVTIQAVECPPGEHGETLATLECSICGPLGLILSEEIMAEQMAHLRSHGQVRKEVP